MLEIEKMDKFSSRSWDCTLIDSKKLIMVNYLMNLTEISRSQILDNLFPQKNVHHNE